MPDKQSQVKGGGGGPSKSVWQGTARAGLPTPSPEERKAVRKKRRMKLRQPQRWIVPDKK